MLKIENLNVSYGGIKALQGQFFGAQLSSQSNSHIRT